MSSFAPNLPLLGVRQPRLVSVAPGRPSDLGERAIRLAALAGLRLDDWQADVLDASLQVRDDGRWASFEVGLVVSRQNGKGAVLEARELAGLFLVPDEELILHSAHEFKTTSEHFRRLLALIQSTPDLRREVLRIRTQAGAEAIELRNGKRLRFVARSKASGRGFSGDLIVLDEAQMLGDEEMAALLPTLSARPNPQVVYAGSAGDEKSVQLGRIRMRALAGGDRSLTYFEWSATEDDDPADPVTWAKANPALGIRISEDHVRNERASLAAEGFAQERLGIGRWPTDDEGWSVIPVKFWDGRQMELPAVPKRNPLAFAIDASPGQRSAAIAVASWVDRGVLVEIPAGDYGPGIGWVVDRVLELRRKYRPRAGIIVDPRGPASGLIPELEARGVEVLKPSLQESAAAFAQFTAGVFETADLWHLGQGELSGALKGAVAKETGDGGKLWARKDTTVDICPLVAATLAQWALRKYGRGYDIMRSFA